MTGTPLRDGLTTDIAYRLGLHQGQGLGHGGNDLSVMAFFPIKGFLGTDATFEADLNLVVQVVMGAALIGGSCLAKRKRYAAHGICQTSVLLLNLGMIGLVM